MLFKRSVFFSLSFLLPFPSSSFFFLKLISRLIIILFSPRSFDEKGWDGSKERNFCWTREDIEIGKRQSASDKKRKGMMEGIVRFFVFRAQKKKKSISRNTDVTRNNSNDRFIRKSSAETETINLASSVISNRNLTSVMYRPSKIITFNYIQRWKRI